jgi:large subunit ribosomal protein L29
MKKSSEIKEFTTKELAEKIQDEKNLLLKMRINHAISPLENPMKLKFSRKHIAKMMTELRKRQLNEKKQ